MSAPNNKYYHVRDVLKSVEHEGMKLWRVYDSSARVVLQYECGAKTADGEWCLKTQYAYDGTSLRVLAQKESLDLWSSAWDVL